MAKATNSQKSFDPADIVKKYNSMKRSQTSAGFLKLESGKEQVVRLMLFTDSSGNERLYMEYLQNYVPQLKQSFINPEQFGGKRSPFSVYVDYLIENEGKTELTNRMSDKKRYLFNVLVDGEIKLLECGSMLAEDIFAVFANDDYGNIADVRTGRQLKISKTGSGLDTEYTAHPRPKVEAIPQSVLNSIKVINLEEYVKERVKEHSELVSLLEKTFDVVYEDIEGYAKSSGEGKEEKPDIYPDSKLKGMDRNALMKYATTLHNDYPDSYEKPNQKWDKTQLIQFIKTGIPF